MTLPLGKHSGRHAFSRACAEAGLDLDEDELVEAFASFKARADQGGAVSIHELFQEVTLS
jgi:2-isopropylmalate synthase